MVLPAFLGWWVSHCVMQTGGWTEILINVCLLAVSMRCRRTWMGWRSVVELAAEID